MRESQRIGTRQYNVSGHARKEYLDNCFPGNISMCLACENHCELVGDNEILSGNVRKKWFA